MLNSGSRQTGRTVSPSSREESHTDLLLYITVSVAAKSIMFIHNSEKIDDIYIITLYLYSLYVCIMYTCKINY